MGNTKKQSKENDDKAIPKTITLLPKHAKFIDAKSINLSRFVQKALDQEIEAQGWKEE